MYFFNYFPPKLLVTYGISILFYLTVLAYCSTLGTILAYSTEIDQRAGNIDIATNAFDEKST
jgi:hypothetical protein